MPPFAGVGVNVGMQDALDLANEVTRSRDENGWKSPSLMQASLSAAVRRYEEAMWARAKEDAERTAMYLDLFFNERGGRAMIEHFEAAKEQERNASEAD
jgi:2-polyprenyl-6-methoxyphenol hydroxylase-like FAD-dependent oxidoreductase